jgi:hypothetical protein
MQTQPDTEETPKQINAELLEACELAAGYKRWCVMPKANRCHPTERDRNERWRFIQSKLDAAVSHAREALSKTEQI